ncbi:hypothetical protein CLBKND_01036 [Methylorubrum aminovorans]
MFLRRTLLAHPALAAALAGVTSVASAGYVTTVAPHRVQVKHCR